MTPRGLVECSGLASNNGGQREHSPCLSPNPSEEPIMNLRFTRVALRLRAIFSRGVHGTRRIAATGVRRAAGAGGLMIATAVAAGAGYLLWVHPPMESVARGDVAIRTNQLTGGVDEFREGSLLLLPGLHEMRTFSLRDQVYRPEGSSRADGPSPFQSVE